MATRKWDIKVPDWVYVSHFEDMLRGLKRQEEILKALEKGPKDEPIRLKVDWFADLP